MIARIQLAFCALNAAAGMGVALAILYSSIPLIGGGWCWIQVVYTALFALGNSCLFRFKRREALVVGCCCWLFLFVESNGAVRSGLSEKLSYPLMLAGLFATMAGLSRMVGEGLASLPMRPKWLPLLLCFALAGITLLARPYWIARFHGAGANLRTAPLAMTDLHGADLQGSHLERANLRFACLDGANLRGAHLAGADLGSACLDRVDFTGADLEGAKLDGALFDRQSTRWPAHFDPEAHGARERVWL